MGNLYRASRQWANRPDDERFGTIQEAYEATRSYALAAKEETVQTETFGITRDSEDNLCLSYGGGSSATLTNWAFKQICGFAGAPVGYLQTLPGELATRNLAHGLHQMANTEKEALVHRNGTTVLRSLTSNRYKRIWNYNVLEHLLDAPSKGWKTPPAMDKAERPSGIYASDHDMFVFMVNDEYRVDDGSDGGLGRGFFVSNSEVGAASLRITSFLYRYVCGNHIVWGARDVSDIKMRHVGNIHSAFDVEIAQFMRASKVSARDDEELIKRAKFRILGESDEEVLATVFRALTGSTRKGKPKALPQGVSQGILDKAYIAAKQFEAIDGNPRSVWGFVNGLTRVSQGAYADIRTAIDSATKNLLAIAA